MEMKTRFSPLLRSADRRAFLKSAVAMAASAPLSSYAEKSLSSTPFPFVDGLCVDIGSDIKNIKASGLSGLLADVSAVAQIKAGDGKLRWQRSFPATISAIEKLRDKLSGTSNAFIATEGSQIGSAFSQGKTAVFLQLQGGGELVGVDLSRIAKLKALGVKALQITHHDNNPLGGGSLVKSQVGLTPLGFEAIERLNAFRIIPDLSHASDPTALDTLKASKRPVIISHGAARAILKNARCAPDDVIRGIAKSGGVMGIFMMSFWLTAEDSPTVDSYLRQIRHVIKVGGIDSIGIANDFPLTGDASFNASGGNNAVAVQDYLPWWNSVEPGVLGFDITPKHVAIPELNSIRRMFKLHAALERARFSAAEIEKIMGRNWIRVLSEA